MARKVINTGVNYNDGTGDKLRDAMTKINDNFNELYATTEFSTNIAFDANRISTLNTNGNLLIDPNGTGQLVVNSGAVINAGQQPNGTFTVLDSTGNNLLHIDPFYKNVGINAASNNQGLDVAGNLTVVGNSVVLDTTVILGNIDKPINFAGSLNSSIIPLATNVFNLGSTDNRFQDGWFFDITADIGNLATLNSTDIYGANVTATNEMISGNLVIRLNEISNTILDQDIEINPFGTGNLRVNTRMVVGAGEDSPLGEAIIKAVENVEGYIQSTIQNLNSGAASSADFFIPADDGDDEDKFIDIGINSSNYSSPEFAIHTPRSSYIFTSTSDLFIGTATENDLVFHANGTDASHISFRIKASSNSIIIANEDGSTLIQDTGERLQVKASARFSDTIAIASSTPASSMGVDGDHEGMISWDSDYFYVCTADYDGSTNIWKRSSLGGTW